MKAAVIIAIGTGFAWLVLALVMAVRAVSLLHAFLILGAHDSFLILVATLALAVLGWVASSHQFRRAVQEEHAGSAPRDTAPSGSSAPPGRP